MTKHVHESKSLNMACPHCGGMLDVIMEPNENIYMPESSPAGFECIVNACSASWDLDGKPITEPRWVTDPDKFKKPE